MELFVENHYPVKTRGNVLVIKCREFVIPILIDNYVFLSGSADTIRLHMQGKDAVAGIFP